MTAMTNTLEGGSDGVTLTSGAGGNTGGASGDYFDQIDREATGGVVRFLTSDHYQGSVAVELATRATAGSSAFRWSTSRGQVVDDYGRCFFKVTDLPASAVHLLRFYSTLTNSYGAVSFAKPTTTGHLYISGPGVGLTSIGDINANQWYRLEWHHHADAAGGSLQVKVWADPASSGSPDINYTASFTTGYAYTDIVIFGQAGTLANYPTATGFVRFDNLNSGFSDWLGPLVSTQHLYPSADSADGTWTDHTGGTALAAEIDEQPTPIDSDYVQSVVNPSAAGMRVKLSTGSTPQSGTKTFRWRIGKDAAGGATVTLTAKIREDATLSNVYGTGTLVQSFQRVCPDSPTTYEETLTNAVSDWSKLYLEIEATQS